ncbi:trimethylamine methyltransferase family protein [Desulfosarcina variabilis]|uniref:trimethylamine methyltransferase family protein n=1 Tax=Desulfosarcina variabilis TaxID=2300 RepID=UPI003AFA4AE4
MTISMTQATETSMNVRIQPAKPASVVPFPIPEVSASDRLTDLPMLARVHKDAMRVLEEVGVKCTDPTVRELFENTGMAAFDETTGHIHVLSSLVEQALETTPKAASYWIPENAFGVGGTAPFIHDDMTGDLVQPTIEHLVQIAKIADKADDVAFMARGVLIRNREVDVMNAMIEHFHKPIYVAAVTEEGIRRAEEIHHSRGGITVQFSIINSPLSVIGGMLPPFLECVRRGIPVYVSTMPMAGLSAPYSMSGLLTLTHAEALFGITLAQLVNPGTVVVPAGLPSIASINKKYAVDLGLLSHNAANLLLSHVYKRLDLPSIHSGCTTHEEHPSVLAEADAANGFALMKKYGFTQMRHAFGFLKELVSFSIAKLERHINLCRETSPDSAPAYEFEDYDQEGFTAIQRNGSAPNYMRDEHTLKNTGRQFCR